MSSESESPPSPDSVPPEASERGSRRRRLEGVIPEIVRRAVELGVEKAQEAPDNIKQLIHDMKLPKEIAHYLFVQVDETKNGLFRVVAKEIRDFLEHTNFAGEVQKLLTTVQFEVNTTIRFSPNDGSSKKKSAKDKEKDKEKEPGAEASPAEADSGAERRPSSSPSPRGSTSLPKPEVKTSVSVRRDDSDP